MDDNSFPHTLPYSLVSDVEDMMKKGESAQKIVGYALRWAANEVRFKTKYEVGSTLEYVANVLSAQAKKAEELVWK